MKRSPLKRNSPIKAKSGQLSSLKKTNGSLRVLKPMRRVSTKRAKENKTYTKVRKEYMLVHPQCEVCNGTAATDIHHRRGRWKSRLTDTAFFLAVCRGCHDRIHYNPTWAYETGLMLPR